MKFKKISSRVFSFICLVGFLVQVEEVSELYFRFQTTSRTMYQIQEADYHQSIMYCPRFADLVGKSAMNMKENPNLPRLSREDYARELDIAISRLTIKDILELTLPESDAILECVVRRGEMSEPTYFRNNECETFFKVSKSVNGERICYTFIPKTRKRYSVGSVATSSMFVGTVYRIHPNPRISRSTVAMFVSTSSMTNANGTFKDPLHSRLFMANIFNINSFNLSRLLVNGESIEIHRLPPPYDTRCTAGHDQELCHENCLINKFKSINKRPWSGFHRDTINIQMLSASDLKNETVSNYTSRSIAKCLVLCKQESECFTKFSRTTVEQYQAEDFSISSMVPSMPHMFLHAIPTLNLVEYIIQIGSCFGMWFGLSIISFNPVKWKTLRKKNTSIVINIPKRRLFHLNRNRRQQ